MAGLTVGSHVELADGRFAIVRFIGQPHFAEGDWVGIELDESSGKNDGSVQGERYFECEMGKGMFIRPQALTVIESRAPPKPAAPKRVGRPPSVVAPAKRASVQDPAGGKRMTMNAASPSPAARLSRPSSILRSPTKSPTKQLASAANSGASTPRTGTPSVVTRTPSISTTKPRQSIASGTKTAMGPPLVPASRTSRSSISGPSGGAIRPGPQVPRTLAGRALAQRPGSLSISSRMGSGGSQRSSAQLSSGSGQDTADEDQRTSPDALSQKPLSPVLSRTSATDRNSSTPTSARSATSPVLTRSTAGNTAMAREVEDLKTKLRLMERKRMEDRDKLKALEKIQAERDKFEGIIQKLQLKYAPQQQEITDLRKQLKEAATKFEEIENLQAEHDLVVEMATLDREMAEETAEVLKTELEALKDKAEELELEVEVLREENAELGSEMSPEEKASQGWIQMERNNERLKEALLRLRDMTQEQEAELRDQIKSLEEDLRDLSGVKEHYETVKEKLATSEASIEDLRQQLDDALGAEDMIEELTERNMKMAEEIEELKITIEDLESLKELNDELEINHVETEKELQEDLDFKDTVINEQGRRAAQQEETIEDMEYTLSRFRELVTSLQSDLEDMKASHAVTETESEQLNERSRAMMDLNMKLQVSAAKTQVKTIELELRRLEAQEASDHLAIVKLFLPEGYQTDKDSVLALLRFKRVAFKANLLHGFVKERINNHFTGHEDDLFAACDVLDKLAWVAAMCDRFINAVSHCSTEQFARYEGALFELEPVERALNGWIDGLRRDELKERQCASDLQRSIALMSHLAEAHISDGLESYADDIHMRALVMQSNLENTATALSATRTMVQSIIPSKGEDDELAQYFSRKADAIINHTRSAKVIIGKAVRSLEDLKNRSLSLTPDTIQNFEQCEAGTQELADFSRRVGQDLYTLLHEEGRVEPFTYIEVQSTVHRTTTNVFATSESDIFSTFTNKLRSLTNLITDLSALASDLEMTQEFERAQAPWIIRSQELSSSRTMPADREEEMRRIRDDLVDRSRAIALKDQMMDEMTVKIELLESRMRDAAKRQERLTEHESKISELKTREKELSEAIETQNKEFAALEADKEKWKKIAGEAKVADAVDPSTKAGQERAVATAREMNALKSQIESLESAVKYLREDNRRARLCEPRNLDWLAEPLVKLKSKTRQRRELVVAEGKDVLHELLTLAGESKLYELKNMPKNRMAWRPARSTPQYHVARQKENYEAWSGWKEEVVGKGRELLPRPQRTVEEDRGQPLARIQMRLPRLGKAIQGQEVRIVDPGEFEQFGEGLGTV